MPDFKRMMSDVERLTGQEAEVYSVWNGMATHRKGIVKKVVPFGYILFGDGYSVPFAGRDATQMVKDSEGRVVYVCEIPDDWFPTDEKIEELRRYMFGDGDPYPNLQTL